MSPRPAVIHSDPDVLGGTPVFVGTRVPFRNLIDYLERGHSLDDFLDEFRRLHAGKQWPLSKQPARP
jgi:uncharacterized protein (DUF433 family)